MTLHIKNCENRFRYSVVSKWVTCCKWCNFHLEGIAGCTQYFYTISQFRADSQQKENGLLFEMTFPLPYSSQIDEIWTTVAKAVVGGTLGSAANVFESDNETYVICVYTEDFTNKEEVWAAEKSLRKLGVKFRLCYKPNIYTTLGIYAGNEWQLFPTIYRSI